MWLELQSKWEATRIATIIKNVVEQGKLEDVGESGWTKSWAIDLANRIENQVENEKRRYSR